MLKITDYAQRLIDDLDDVDFIERVKIQQRNWIGRSTGAEVTFKTNTGDRRHRLHDPCRHPVRRDLHGHLPRAPAARRSGSPISRTGTPVAAYQDAAAHKSDFERGELNKEKTGVPP